MVSELSIPLSYVPSTRQPGVEVVPVVVIPERRSSLKSSASTSRNHSTSRSWRSSRQAANMPGSRTVSQDTPRRKKQANSVSVGQEPAARGRSFSRPEIPPRSSSLSAPTSKNNSRATSLTSESLRSHTLAMDREVQRQQTEQQRHETAKETLVDGPGDARQGQKMHSILIGVEDMSNLRPPSLPFTQGSIPSSSPGPI